MRHHGWLFGCALALSLGLLVPEAQANCKGTSCDFTCAGGGGLVACGNPATHAACDTNNDGICTICGTTGANDIDGTPGVDKICGDSGDDVIDGGSGDDSIYGGNGNDVITGGNDDNLLDGEDDADDITDGSGNGNLLGGSGDDTIVAAAGDDTVDGGPGDDVITGGTGHDVLDGGGGDDDILDSSGGGMLIGGSGDDTLETTATDPHDDSVLGTALCGGKNDDLLMAGGYGKQCMDPEGGQGVGSGDDCVYTEPNPVQTPGLDPHDVGVVTDNCRQSNPGTLDEVDDCGC